MAGIDALLQLQRLMMAPGRAAPYGINPEMNEGTTYYSDINPRPSGLPDAVRRSLRVMPSYGEGERMPPQREPWSMYQDFERERQLQELGRYGVPGREDRLVDEMAFLREPKQYPRPEGFPLTAPDRYSLPSYNLGLGNLGVLF